MSRIPPETALLPLRWWRLERKSPMGGRKKVRMVLTLFSNVMLLDSDHGDLRAGYELLVQSDTIRGTSEKPLKSQSATVVDCGGRTLTPGLIDTHVHVFLSEVFFPNLECTPPRLMTARTVRLMEDMIDRGFTSVRDGSGADCGIKGSGEGRRRRSAPVP